MTYEALINSIQSTIKSNGNAEITGDLLQRVLISIVNNFQPLILPVTASHIDQAYERGETYYIENCAAIIDALKDNRPIHIKPDNINDGYYIVEGYLDGTGMLDLIFLTSRTCYSLYVDPATGEAEITGAGLW